MKKQELGDIIELKRGYDLPSSVREGGNIPVVSSSGISDYHSIAKVKAPGVVTGRYGTIGNVFYVKEDFWPLNTTLYVKDFKGNLPSYISYLLQCLNIKELNAAGAVPGVNRNHLHKIRTTIHDLPTQRKIANILSAYDDLIENNQKRIKLLEEKARLTYEEWFVHLKFPGHATAVIDAATGLPEGWRRVPFSELVQINPRTPLKKDELTPYVSMSKLSSGSMNIEGFEMRTPGSGSKFMNGDTLFARITPCLENGKTGFVQFLATDEAVAWGSTEFVVFRETKTCGRYFIYCTSRSNEFRENAIKSMAGSDGRQRVKPACFDSYIVNYCQDLLNSFEQLAGPIFTSINHLNKQNQLLKEARDILLPRLMTGLIDVDNLKV